MTDINTGEYGDPPRFYPWFKQLIIFLWSWVWVKAIVAISILKIPILSDFATWLISPLEHNQKAQIVFVMFVFPLCMNLVQALLTDIIIKGKLATYNALEDDIVSISPTSSEYFDALDCEVPEDEIEESGFSTQEDVDGHSPKSTSSSTYRPWILSFFGFRPKGYTAVPTTEI